MKLIQKFNLIILGIHLCELLFSILLEIVQSHTNYVYFAKFSLKPCKYFFTVFAVFSSQPMLSTCVQEEAEFFETRIPKR